MDPTGHKAVDYAGAGAADLLLSLYNWVSLNSADIVQTAVDMGDCMADPGLAGCAQLAPDVASLMLPGQQAGPKAKPDETTGGPSGPNFVVTPKGVAVPVPEGVTGQTPADNGKGFQFKGGSGGGNGLPENIKAVRIMDSVPARGNHE